MCVISARVSYSRVASSTVIQLLSLAHPYPKDRSQALGFIEAKPPTRASNPSSFTTWEPGHLSQPLRAATGHYVSILCGAAGTLANTSGALIFGLTT